MAMGLQQERRFVNKKKQKNYTSLRLWRQARPKLPGTGA
jgi:hypothetical protein